ncbi:MAG: type II toxin-antitoxin system VapB family antitoxin [Xanthomonadaceae bacterium]|nr:type II toxin-antitoxin system VapB family antitoxin [Xanthomonadaceae bacterium]
MKTTIEINDALLKRARSASRRQGTTLRALVEQGLQQVLSTPTTSESASIETLVFDGPVGLAEPYADASWSRIKEESRRR